MTEERDGEMTTSGVLRTGWLQTTSWTLIKGAAGTHPDEDARREVFRRYYRPVCKLIAAITRDASIADEYTSDFFVEKIFKEEGAGLLDKVDPKKGKFRPYLKQAVRNYLKDLWKKPDPDPVDPNASGADLIFGEDWPDPDEAFHREWVRMLLEQALKRVREDCDAKGQLDYLEMFLAWFASDEEKRPSWGEIGARYGLDGTKARRRAETVQRRFRTALREVLIDEEGSREAAGEELATLLALLRDSR